MEIFKHKLLLDKNLEFKEIDYNKFFGDFNTSNSSQIVYRVSLNKFSEMKLVISNLKIYHGF